MRYSWLLVAVMFCAALPAQVSDSNPFATNAKFSFDDDEANVPKEVQHRKLSLSSAVAIIGPPSGPMNDSWIEINFYSFPFTPQDFKAAQKGDKTRSGSKGERSRAAFRSLQHEIGYSPARYRCEATSERCESVYSRLHLHNRNL